MHDFARSLATTLLDGSLDRRQMAARVRDVFASERPWIDRLARAIEIAFIADDDDEESAVESTIDAVAEWLVEQPAFHAAIAEHPLVRDPRMPEMRESPWRVPALATSKELASWLGVGIAALVALADRRDYARSARDPRMRHYRYTWLAKRGGGERLLEAPKRRLRTVQRYILDDIVAAIPPHAAAHGFRRAHSIAGFAAPHVGHEVVIRVDLRAFFASVTIERVRAIFATAGYPNEVAATRGSRIRRVGRCSSHMRGSASTTAITGAGCASSCHPGAHRPRCSRSRRPSRSTACRRYR